MIPECPLMRPNIGNHDTLGTALSSGDRLLFFNFYLILLLFIQLLPAVLLQPALLSLPDKKLNLIPLHSLLQELPQPQHL